MRYHFHDIEDEEVIRAAPGDVLQVHCDGLVYTDYVPCGRYTAERIEAELLMFAQLDSGRSLIPFPVGRGM